MNYTKLAEESSKIFEAFGQAGWCDEWAYELSKTCIREFPIFRDMIEGEKTPEQVIGYVHFKSGAKEAIYKREMYDDVGNIVVYTEFSVYRRSDELMDDPLYFNPILKPVYHILDSNENWKRIFTIDHIEFI